MKRKNVTDIIACLFIILFLYTGIYKLIDQNRFIGSMRKVVALYYYAPFVAILIPAAEIIVSFFLLTGLVAERPKYTRWGLYGSFILMLLFTGYVSVILSSDDALPCTCGGIIETMGWHKHLYFNIIFTMLALAGIWLNKKDRQINSQNIALS